MKYRSVRTGRGSARGRSTSSPQLRCMSSGGVRTTASKLVTADARPEDDQLVARGRGRARAHAEPAPSPLRTHSRLPHKRPHPRRVRRTRPLHLSADLSPRPPIQLRTERSMQQRPPKVFLVAGDVVEVKGIGVVRNPIVSGDDRCFDRARPTQHHRMSANFVSLTTFLDMSVRIMVLSKCVGIDSEQKLLTHRRPDGSCLQFRRSAPHRRSEPHEYDRRSPCGPDGAG